MSLFTIYLLTRLTAIADLALCLSIAAAAAILFCVLLIVIEDLKELTPWVKRLFITFCITSSIFVLLPSTKEAFMIIGGYALVNNEEVQKLPANVLGAANGFLEEYIQDAKKEVQEVTKGK